MVKLNLNAGEHNIDIEGKVVIALVMEPKNHDSNCAAMIVGETSPHNAAVAMGCGVGSILSQLGKNTFDRVTLAQLVIKQIKDAIDGDSIAEKDIFEGTVDEFMEKGMGK